ncbi:MAG: tyrosine-type recombinase/integrase [Saprospiraceae bacterium]|nr:tyrosine-type recombinase/integrase [Saprospiraceae bacterium]
MCSSTKFYWFTIYGCGLRCFQSRSVRLQDPDFDRKVPCCSRKGKKDRYVPLSDRLIRGLRHYIEAEGPEEWLFTGQLLENR